MSARVDPANWPTVIELAQGCRIARLPDGQTINTERSKFMRLSADPFPDLRATHLKNLRDLCVAAHRSEEFFLRSGDAKQWLRTAVKSKRTCRLELFSQSLLEGEQPHRNIYIHSNVLPCDPFWPIRDETCWHFPFCILEDALAENETLFNKLREWDGVCDIGVTRSEDLQQSPSGPMFWDVNPKEVSKVQRLVENVWVITWRGGHFIAKDYTCKELYERELQVVAELCHPHVVYIFGRKACDQQPGGSIYMERMESDLLTVIVNKAKHGVQPPYFSHHDSIDILWQVAKAMAHLHEKKVIHCDLKTLNILIGSFKISERQSYYLAKVADFGSAKFYYGGSFEPGEPTPLYAAPEVLQFFPRIDDPTEITDPTKIDVFSFGIVGFEVITGEKIYKRELEANRWSTVKREIMRGTLRPPLRAICLDPRMNYLKDERVIDLIERCWHQEPSERPPFSDIVETLGNIRRDYLAVSASSSSPQAANDDVIQAANDDEHSGQVSTNSEIISVDQTSPRNTNGHHASAPPLQVDPPNVKIRNKRRATKALRRFLRHFSCVSGGKVESPRFPDSQ